MHSSIAVLNMTCNVQDNTPGTDRNRHNQQSVTENTKEVLPGTKEHEGANEGLGHKIAKHIPGCVSCQLPCNCVCNEQILVTHTYTEPYPLQTHLLAILWVSVVLPVALIAQVTWSCCMQH